MPEEKKIPQKTVTVLCDFSESTTNIRKSYFESFKKVVSSINHGDVIIFAKITEASIAEPEIPIKEIFPEFVPKDNSGKPTDNPILMNSSLKKADAERDKKKEMIIEVAEKNIFPESTNKNEKRIIRTDILSSLHLAEKIIKSYKRDKPVLVLLSDMIEDSTEYNFEKENLTDRRIEEIINKERKRNRIPDLKGVKVYVVAASEKGSEKFFAIQNFWLRYFKECGANLSKENYGSALLSFDE